MFIAIAPEDAVAHSIVTRQEDRGQEYCDADGAGSFLQQKVYYVQHTKRRVRLHGHGICGLREQHQRQDALKAIHG